jgi:hypothetical protein
MIIHTELKNYETSLPVWQQKFESSVGIMMTIAFGPAYDKSLNRMLEDAKQKLYESFSGNEFYNRFKSL